MENSGRQSHSSMSEDYTEIWGGVHLRTKLAYSMGHVLNDVCASMWFTYLLVFFHLVLEFNPTQAGLVLLIGQVADALATTFVGYFSDRNDDFRICKYGRRKTWHLIGTACTLVGFPFIFTQCIGCQTSDKWAQLVYFAAFVIIFQFGWAAVQISHLSLIPELTPNEHDRTGLTALRYSMTVFSNVLVYVTTWVSFGYNPGRVGPDDAFAFTRVMWAGLSVGIVASFLFHIGVKEQRPTAPTGVHIRAPIARRSICSILADGNLYLVGCTYMSTRLYVNLSQVVLPLYLHETLQLGAQSLASVPLAAYLSSFVSSFIVQILNKYLGRKIAFFISVLIALGASTWLLFGNGPDYATYEIYAVAVLIGAAGSIMLVTSLGLTADLIGNDTNNGALVYGFMSFTDKLSNGIVVVVIQHLHATTFQEMDYYKYILSWVCGSMAVLGLLGSTFVKIQNSHSQFGYSRHNNENFVVENNEPS